MAEIWEKLVLFLGAHKVAAISAASVVAAGVAGVGGYTAYQHFNTPEEVEVEVVEENQVEQEAAELPDFKSVKITSDSLEKDITIYISDVNDEVITGTAFSVKLVKPEDAESLSEYVSAIQSLNQQIAALTGANCLDTGAATEETSDEDTSDEDTEEAEATTEVVEANTSPVEVTITDENGDEVDTYTPVITTDSPIYQLYCDKEVAVQAYAIALNDIAGDVYTDDDMDGIITQSDMEAGDYVACLMYTDDVLYDPVTYETEVNVKDKVEYKVVSEITKKVEADKPSEDGQKAVTVTQEATLKDTVEYVESSKSSKGSTVKSTTKVKVPTATNAKSSKATKNDGSVTSVSHDITTSTTKYTVTIKNYYYKNDGTTAESDPYDNFGSESVAKGTEKTYKASDYAARDGYTLMNDSSQTVTVNSNIEIAFKYKSNTAEKKTYTITVKDKYLKSDGSEEKTETRETKTYTEGDSYSYDAKSPDGYTVTSDKNYSGTVSADKEIVFTYKAKEEEKTEDTSTESSTEESSDSESENSGDTAWRGPSGALAVFSANTKLDTLGLKLLTKGLLLTTTTTTTETATLDMTYSAGTFTIKASSNVSGIAINGTELSSGTTTYKVTADGDYKLTGTATFSDGATDTTLAVTYTVSGITGSASTDKLLDTSGHELYVDEDCTTLATAADYKEGTTYYYLEDDYTYYGWQNINGLSYYYDKDGNAVTGTQVIQGVSYNFGSDGALIVNGTGIDVSKYQGKITWSSAASSISFAIVRCGYRGMYDGALHEDPYFYTNMSGAKSAGVATGIYIYSTALTEAEAVEEASMAVSMAQKAGGCSYPIYIDMEDSTRGVKSLSNAQRDAIITAFCTTVQSAGYKAGVYASKTWMSGLIDVGSIPSSCYIWVAQYNTSCTYSGKYSMWQYSSKGSVPGISGSVDMNKSYF